MPIDRSDSGSLLRSLADRPLLFDGAMGTTVNDFEDRDWEAPEEVTVRYPDRMLGICLLYTSPSPRD